MAKNGIGTLALAAGAGLAIGAVGAFALKKLSSRPAGQVFIDQPMRSGFLLGAHGTYSEVGRGAIYNDRSRVLR